MENYFIGLLSEWLALPITTCYIIILQMFGYGQYRTLNTIHSTPSWVSSIRWKAFWIKINIQFESLSRLFFTSFHSKLLNAHIQYVVRFYELYQTTVFSKVDILIEVNDFIALMCKTWRSKSIFFFNYYWIQKVFQKTI